MFWRDIWRDLRLRTKGLIVIAVPAAATVLIACTSYLIEKRAAGAERLVNQSLLVSEGIQHLRANQIEAIANVCGYFITSEESFVDRTRESIASFDAIWQKLLGLTSANPTMTRILYRIAAMQRARVERLIGATARFRSGALSWEQRREQARAAEAERQEMEKLLQTLEGEENSLLEEHMRQVRPAHRASRHHRDTGLPGGRGRHCHLAPVRFRNHQPGREAAAGRGPSCYRRTSGSAAGRPGRNRRLKRRIGQGREYTWESNRGS